MKIDSVEAAEASNLKYCHMCRGFVGKSENHCVDCEKCSPRLDHHCLWLNNCIGAENYLNFYLLLIVYFIHGLLTVALTVSSFFIAAGEEDSSLVGSLNWIITSILVLIIEVPKLVAIGYLIVVHTKVQLIGTSMWHYLWEKEIVVRLEDQVKFGVITKDEYEQTKKDIKSR